MILDYNCENLGFIFRIASYLFKILRIAIPMVLIVFVSIDAAKLVINANVDEKVKKDTTNKMVKRLLYALIIFLIPTLVTFVFNQLSNSTPSGYGNDSVENSPNAWLQCFREFFE